MYFLVIVVGTRHISDQMMDNLFLSIMDNNRITPSDMHTCAVRSHLVTLRLRLICQVCVQTHPNSHAREGDCKTHLSIWLFSGHLDRMLYQVKQVKVRGCHTSRVLCDLGVCKCL